MSIRVPQSANGELSVTNFFSTAITKPLTICGWIKVEAFNLGGYQFFEIVQIGDATDHFLTRFISDGGNPIQLQLRCSATTAKFRTIDMTGNIENVWVPFVSVFNSSDNNGTIYSKDSLDATISSGAGDINRNPVGADNLVILGTWANSDVYLDNIRIYETELTQTQAEEFFTSGEVVGATELVSWDTASDWGVGDIPDSSGNGLDITPAGTWVYSSDNAPVTAGVSVTQADTTPEDGVQQSFTTSGLSGTITAASLGGADILSLLSNTDPTTATTYTYDISATEASAGTARIGQTSTLSITATGGTATQDVTIGAKTGWAVVTLGTPDKTANGLIATLEADLGITISAGNYIYYDTSNNASVSSTGVYTSDLTTAGQFTELVVIQGGTATTTATSEGAAFYPYGEAASGGTGGSAAKSINLSKIRIGL